LATDQVQHARALQDAGKYAEAEAIYRDILRHEPHNADALHGLSTLAYFRKDYREALALIEQVVALAPAYSAGFNARGNIMLALGQPRAALESYKQAVAVKPHSVAALNNLGNVYLELAQPIEALAVLDRALELVPGHRDALFNRGNAKLKLERRAEAVADYDRSIALDADHLKAFLNRGIALQELGHIDEALESYRQVLRIDPENADAHYNTALCHLINGDLQRGFAEYEWRWRVKPLTQTPQNPSSRRWLGKEDLAGKTLLVRSEQGYGDTLQFARFIPEVAERAGRVVFEVQVPLKPLLAGLESVAHVVAQGEPLPPHDFDCPLLSLPHALGIALDTIPPPTPLLHAQPELVAKWRALLPEKRGLRVGLAWSGRPDHPNDHHRSIAAHWLVSLQLPGVTLVSLQNEYRDTDRNWLNGQRSNGQGQIHDFSDRLNDFADTAALASLMDVIVSVDTSVAHLAGALGKPVWILLPFIALDWRWLLGRDDSPWYPTARLFQQPAIDDWDAVISRVRENLRELLG
jgi:tetratricopeptide (TPR) repeat protein